MNHARDRELVAYAKGIALLPGIDPRLREILYRYVDLARPSRWEGPRFDRREYMREYMRVWRRRKKKSAL